MREWGIGLIIDRKKSLMFLFIGLISLVVFGVICFGVMTEKNWIDVFDRKLIEVIQSNVTETKTNFISFLTEIGNIRLIIVLTIGISIFLFLKKKYVLGLWFGSTIFFFVAIGTRIIKKIVDRTRPDFLPLIEKTTESFPSGHATSATVFYGIIVVALFFLVKKSWSRIILGLSVLILIGFILISRIYLGVHYPTDVIAGFFYGIAAIFFSTGIYYYLHQPLRDTLKRLHLNDESRSLSDGLSEKRKGLSDD